MQGGIVLNRKWELSQIRFFCNPGKPDKDSGIMLAQLGTYPFVLEPKFAPIGLSISITKLIMPLFIPRYTPYRCKYSMIKSLDV